MKKVILMFQLLSLSVLVFSQENEEKVNALTFSASYYGDFLGNTTGGMKKDFAYLGQGTIGLNLNTEAAGWWNGGEFNIAGMSTHGGTPTETFIGDFQCVDNIEAGNHAFLSELWYKQQIADKFSITLGLQDMNAEYAYCDASADYINSSFGISSVFGNFGTPMFPITGLGLNLRWDISDKWAWQAGVYDGGILDFDENPYNIKWKLDKTKGYLTVTEAIFNNEDANHAGVYKLGVSYHTGEEDAVLYANIGQSLWSNDKHELEAFTMAAYSFNANYSDDKDELAAAYFYNNFHIAAGLNLNGVFSKQQKDKLGVAFSTSLFRDFDKKGAHETAIELTYKYQILEQLFVQPDLQYIVKPSTKYAALDNAFVAMLRFGVEF